MRFANNGDGVVCCEQIKDLDYEAVGAVLYGDYASVDGAVADGVEDGVEVDVGF